MMTYRRECVADATFLLETMLCKHINATLHKRSN